MYEVNSANHQLPYCGGKTCDIRNCKALHFNKPRLRNHRWKNIQPTSEILS